MKAKKNKAHVWQDHYSRKAKNEQFPARSVYKLQEIQRKYNLIKKGDAVLDLGCAPGSWLLYAADLVSRTGQVLGIDIKPVSVKLPEQADAITGDILRADLLQGVIKNRFDVILSDMAPSTTGNKTVDSARSFELCQTALSVAKEKLKTGGAFICKIFQGEDFRTFTMDVRGCFKKQKIFKPQSSRKASKEIYIIGMDKK